jgi:hypothetical protein
MSASATGWRRATIEWHLAGFWTCQTPTWPIISSGMPRPPIPRSHDSRDSSRPIGLDVTPSRRARFAWALFASLTAAALCITSSPHPLWRGLAATVAVALGWQTGRVLLTGRGRRAIRRFEWTTGGEWCLERADGMREQARLTDATFTLGPWILLAWAVDGSGRRAGSRRYALIDASAVGSEAFRALRGRLVLASGRPE